MKIKMMQMILNISAIVQLGQLVLY